MNRNILPYSSRDGEMETSGNQKKKKKRVRKSHGKKKLRMKKKKKNFGIFPFACNLQ
jgi:hypothetical protein